MLKATKLPPNGTIGIVNPSKWLEDETLNNVRVQFEDRGYTFVLGETTELRIDQYAGSPEQRARDIESMFANPEVNAILCGRGGYGANRVIPLLDYELIRENPKIFVGYSDITAYLTSITQKTGLVTFHGPMLVTFKDEFLSYNIDNLEAILCGYQNHTIKLPADHPVHILKPGVGEGPLWGGNITLLADRLSTKDQLNATGCILFLEDTHEYSYAIDRLLYHLRRTESLDGINGLIIGEMTKMKDSDVPFGKSLDEIIMDIFGDLNIPILSNFPCGHGRYQATLPISVPVRLDALGKQPIIEMLESPVL